MKNRIKEYIRDIFCGCRKRRLKVYSPTLGSDAVTGVYWKSEKYINPLINILTLWPPRRLKVSYVSVSLLPREI
jgi:hypothetical protein